MFEQRIQQINSINQERSLGEDTDYHLRSILEPMLLMMKLIRASVRHFNDSEPDHIESTGNVYSNNGRHDEPHIAPNDRSDDSLVMFGYGRRDLEDQ